MVKLKKKLLELFCGTKSVSKALGEQEFEVISLDIDPDFEPTICADFMDWDYTGVGAADYITRGSPYSGTTKLSVETIHSRNL